MVIIEYLGLTPKTFRQKVEEAVELATDQKTRAWNMGEILSALFIVTGLNEFPPKFCIMCGTIDLPKRNYRFCSDDCRKEFHDKYYWSWVRSNVLDRNCCHRCGRNRFIPYWNKNNHDWVEGIGLIDLGEGWDYQVLDYKKDRSPIWEVHHIKPVRAHGGGGSIYSMDNLMMLCMGCHDKIHAELFDREKQIKIENYLIQFRKEDGEPWF